MLHEMHLQQLFPLRHPHGEHPQMRIDARLHGAPVVFLLPVLPQRLDCRGGHAVRPLFAGWQVETGWDACCRDALVDEGEEIGGDGDLEGGGF